jgi:protein-disulfide isomerase-like protein with CxxC motif
MNNERIEGATLYITLKTHLENLEAIERAKPREQRRQVPNMGEIAAAVGISATAISNIATNRVNQLTLRTGGKIIAAVRAYGFPMEISDLLGYLPPDAEQRSSSPPEQ